MKIVANLKALYGMLAPRYKAVAWVFVALVVAFVVCVFPFIFMIASGMSPRTIEDYFQGTGIIWTIVGSGSYLSLGFASILSLALNDHLQDQYRIRCDVAVEEMRKKVANDHKQGA